MSPLRILYMAHEHITDIVNKWFGTRPSMDAESLRWHDKELVDVYQKRVKWTPDMLEAMKRGELDGFSEDDLYDSEEDEILFTADPDDVAMATDEEAAASDQGTALRGQMAAVAAMATAGDAATEDGHGPRVPRSWFDTELGRAAMAHLRHSGMAGYKAREAWLAEHKERPLNEARQRFEQELDRAQVEGTTRTVAELAEVCGRDQRTIYRWVEEGRSERTLERIANGKYRRVDA